MLDDEEVDLPLCVGECLRAVDGLFESGSFGAPFVLKATRSER
jgi:hypothetical protein